MRYVDTSVLVAALTREARTQELQNWLGTQTAGELLVSEWVITEFSSALSVKLRNGQLAARERSDALAVFNQIIEDSFLVAGVERSDFRAAARLSDHYATGLRAGDALHLAVAASNGATIFTLDRTLVSAADALGISAELV